MVNEMCGLFGWVKNNHLFTEDEISLARRALGTMSHRGPDFQGEWYNDNVYMGHRRLSIIDLSTEANQPFWDENRRYVTIFNGEIYNYIELKNELQKAGLKFRTSSDTEVLLSAFAFWGKQAFLKFDGMFACAIHDTVTGEHYIFRDYLGQKPLYYFKYNNGIIYASELRAFLNIDCFKWKLDKDNFLKFLFNSYYMWDTTPLKGVKKLIPGCYLKITNDDFILERFWESIPGENSLDITFDKSLSEFQRLLDRSCEITMRSDVPYGIFLSGGIDSSLVLNSCYGINNKVSSFNISIEERDFDEGDKAIAVSEHLGNMKIKSYLMDSRSIQDSINAFFSFSDEPHGDPGFINSYFLAKSCRSDIKVAIAGDGADELFAGYVTFLALKKEDYLNNCPANWIAGFEHIIRLFLSGNDNYLGLQFKALSFLQGFPSHVTTRFPLWLGAISLEGLQKLCPWKEANFFSRNGEEDTILEDFRKVLSVMEGKSRIQTLLYFYQKFFLPEFVCMHTDRAAMQNSMEVRSPFLSRPLIEFANKLPDNFKTDRGVLKKILRQTLRNRSYPELIYKQKKQGFTFPLARWLKTALKDQMNRIFKERLAEGLIDYSYLEFLKAEHLSGKRNNYRILFNFMAFSKWLEKYPILIQTV